MTLEQWLGADNVLGQDIWTRKYRYKNETLEQWFERVSGGNEKVCILMKEKKFLLGGRTLANRNTDKNGSYSNCYSRGYIEDNYEDILEANKQIGLTFKAQGGQGLSLSKLRPKGCGIHHNQFQSDGIIPFMEIYNQTTDSTSQGGSRKGALLMSLDMWHKESEDFIKIKAKEGKIAKANLSMEIDDEFMNAVKRYYEDGEIITKHLKREYEGNIIEYEITPIHLYQSMMENAYDWAEPGCIFTERFRNYNIMQYCEDYQIETCNPCGEQPLSKHSACNLGSINLSEFVIHPFEEKAYFHKEAFLEAVEIAVEALDDIVTEGMYKHPLKEQQRKAHDYRNIGLGIMGMWDMLVKLKVTYGSDKSIEIMDDLMREMFRTAVKKSSKLAKERGNFPNYSEQVWESDIMKKHFSRCEIEEVLKKNGLRNCSILSIAPTGTLGTMFDISTGCEPIFALYYTRKTDTLNKEGKDTFYNVYTGLAKYYKNKYNKELPSYFVTSQEVSWKRRIKLQSILQEHVDTAISSTINLPNETTLLEIEQLYLYAWKMGLKGVTIYRDGCKRSGILSKTSAKKESQTVLEHSIRKKRVFKTGCGTLNVEAFFDSESGHLLEVHLKKDTSACCKSFLDDLKGACCPRAIGNALLGMEQEIKQKLRIETSSDLYSKEEAGFKKANCPVCGEQFLIYEGACSMCKSCGYTKCD